MFVGWLAREPKLCLHFAPSFLIHQLQAQPCYCHARVRVRRTPPPRPLPRVSPLTLLVRLRGMGRLKLGRALRVHHFIARQLTPRFRFLQKRLPAWFQPRLIQLAIHLLSSPQRPTSELERHRSRAETTVWDKFSLIRLTCWRLLLFIS